MGHTLLRGYEDGDPSTNTPIYSGDYSAGAQGAFAALAALWHRDRTGEGQLVEVAQAEAATAMFTQAMMDYTLNGNVHETTGNRDVHGAVPCGVYPCRSEGGPPDDRWIAVHVENDEQWRALGGVLGNPEWASDQRFATNDGRAVNRTELDAKLAETTIPRSTESFLS
jgi:crotonobetainyl-CoA:carnitine CoA-transferase CaiB-like acyl-CoA transferase